MNSLNVKYRKQIVFTGGLVTLFCVGGIVLFVLGFLKYADNREFIAGAKSTTGKVIGFETFDAPGISPWEDIHYAMIAYTTEDGSEIQFRGPSKDSLVRLDQGDVVRVLYHPNAPQDARVDSFMALWFAATLLWIIGVGSIVIPILTLWQAWKWVRRQERNLAQ